MIITDTYCIMKDTLSEDKRAAFRGQKGMSGGWKEKITGQKNGDFRHENHRFRTAVAVDLYLILLFQAFHFFRFTISICKRNRNGRG